MTRQREGPWNQEVEALAEEKRTSPPPDTDERTGQPARLPGFIAEDGIGLGDIVKRATRAVGITPCRGCEERARAMNRWLTLSRRRRHDSG